MSIDAGAFSKIDALPSKPAARRSEPSVYLPMITEIMQSGEARKSPPVSDVANGNKASDAALLDRELRRRQMDDDLNNKTLDRELRVKALEQDAALQR